MSGFLLQFAGQIVTLIAAFIGFSGVIYSQRSLMKRAEEERAHQDRLTKEQNAAKQQREILSFVNAILGELSALEVAISNSRKVLAAQITLAGNLSQSGSGKKTQPRIAFRFSTPVFDSHVGRIGLLSPDLSFRLSNLYGHILSFSAQAQEQVPEMDPSLAVRVMNTVQESLNTLVADIAELKSTLSANYMDAALRID